MKIKVLAIYLAVGLHGFFPQAFALETPGAAPAPGAPAAGVPAAGAPGNAPAPQAIPAPSAPAPAASNPAPDPAAAAPHGVYKRPFNLPPSAELSYSIKARYAGVPITGNGLIRWRSAQGTYSVSSETQAAVVGKVLEATSEGAIDAFGLAPNRYAEIRPRKPTVSALFDRGAQNLHFSNSNHRYPLLGGEQDRTSVIWQLISVARAAPTKFVPGSKWDFFVAGPYDADPWSFKVVDKVTLRTALGNLPCVHIIRLPPPDSKDQQVELWLAPGQEWYPVRVRFLDADGNQIDQLIQKVTRKSA